MVQSSARDTMVYGQEKRMMTELNDPAEAQRSVFGKRHHGEWAREEENDDRVE